MELRLNPYPTQKDLDFHSKMNDVFLFFNEYQFCLTYQDIENIFITQNFSLFQLLESYVLFERKENYFDLKMFPLLENQNQQTKEK